MPEVPAWQNRSLEKVYPFIFMDTIHYKVKKDHRYVTKASYVVLDITMDEAEENLPLFEKPNTDYLDIALSRLISLSSRSIHSMISSNSGVSPKIIFFICS